MRSGLWTQPGIYLMLGSAENTVILCNCPTSSSLRQKLIKSVSHAFFLSGTQLAIGTHIGIYNNSMVAASPFNLNQPHPHPDCFIIRSYQQDQIMIYKQYNSHKAKKSYRVVILKNQLSASNSCQKNSPLTKIHTP